MSDAFSYRWLFLFVLICGFLRESRAQTQVNFADQILPILQEHCFHCHGEDEQESGLRLDQRAAMLRGGDFGGSAIVPGDPKKSFLVAAISGSDPDVKMPPDDDRLSDNQIALITRWIAEGAETNGLSETAESPTTHWAFLPPSRPPVPEVEPAVASPIDAFILRRLRQEGLTANPPTDRRTLIRRVTLDLTGLLPTVAEVSAFLDDPRDDAEAFDAVVDRLLDSPRYGERWAQHWLDVIRWAETVGFETNLERPNAWPYRDWVIDALNRDLPYDQFIFQQLAGDTQGNDAALGFLVAGPANLPAQIGRDEEAMRQARQDELDEVIRTVSQSLFGLTIGCARCHNHKFDPILQRDYYSMQAVFAALRYGDRRLRGKENDQWTKKIPEAKRRLADLQAELETLQNDLKLRAAVADVQTEHFEATNVSAVRIEIQATNNGSQPSLWEWELRTPQSPERASENVALASQGGVSSASSFALENQTRHHENAIDGQLDRRQSYPWRAKTSGPGWLQVDLSQPTIIDHVVLHKGYSAPVDYKILVLADGQTEWTEVANSDGRMLRADDSRAAEKVSIAGLDREQVNQLVSLNGRVRSAQAELSRLSGGPKVYAASFRSDPEPTWLLTRGDPMRRKEILAPSVPQFLEQSKPSSSTEELESSRRIALAKHLMRGDHPLTSRVMVNRIWQHHFGTGLVETPSDFGAMGASPTHPELLDWLATSFVENGWSIKTLHRMILSSDTYRQSATPNQHSMAVDASARLLWRFPPRRLEAEAIRDSMLLASGKLQTKMGGKGFNLFKQRGGLSGYTPLETFEETGHRRMVYAHKIRMQSVDIFGAFDCPDAGQMRPKRTQSITPLQAFGLFNSPFVQQQSEYFAGRVESEVEGVESHVRRVFEIALARTPNEKESEVMIALARDHGLQQVCRVIFNSSEFLLIQ